MNAEDNMNRKPATVKYWIVIVLLLASVIAAYTMPVMHYKGTGFISKLEIPLSVGDWQGKDVTNELNLDFDKNWNKFISEALIYEYTNAEGKRLVFIILDAGNFHHPNVCFTAAGFEIKEIGDTEFNIRSKTIKAHTLFTTKQNQSNLSFYWIIIDKEITEKWIDQKIKQLYFSLFNRQRVGLMVRIDVPTRGNNINDAVILAKQFIQELKEALPREKSEYIMGIN